MTPPSTFSSLATTLRRLAVCAVPFMAATSSVALPVENKEVRIDVGGYGLNSLLLRPSANADLPPIVFIHGASASLYDQVYSFRAKLEGRATLLFVDRPGHGKSQIGGRQNISPDGQADAIATLMTKRGIDRAIIVSHSFGGSVAAALALNHPDRVLGLVFLSPAVYPWPGGIAWYYEAASAPVTGWLFSGLIAPMAGLIAIDAATKGVFAPNRRPDDYIRKARALQALRPTAFRHNAMEIANLLAWATINAPRYTTIRSSTVIITGDTDDVVSPSIHSQHLARDIRGARLLIVHNLGHKSDYVANDLAIAAIETVAGGRPDLEGIKRRVEKRIASDRW